MLYIVYNVRLYCCKNPVNAEQRHALLRFVSAYNKSLYPEFNAPKYHYVMTYILYIYIYNDIYYIYHYMAT